MVWNLLKPQRHKAFFYFLCVLCVFVVLINPVQYTQADEKTDLLEQGKQIEMQLKSGEIHSYQLNLDAGWFVHLIVEQKGADLVLALSEPNGKRLLDLNNQTG